MTSGNYTGARDFGEETGSDKLVVTAKQYGDELGQLAAKAGKLIESFIGPKASMITEKLKNTPRPAELAESATEYAKKNPGQALLISAAAGLVLGALIGSARR